MFDFRSYNGYLLAMLKAGELCKKQMSHYGIFIEKRSMNYWFDVAKEVESQSRTDILGKQTPDFY